MARRKLDYLPVADLLSAERNPKEHRPDLIAASVSRFGFVEPIVLDERTGTIISGHGRRDELARAEQAGEQPPDGIVVKDGKWLAPVQRGWASKDDIEALAAGIALNQVGVAGGWKLDELAPALQELDALGDLGLEGIGFEVSNIDEILATLNAQEVAGRPRASDEVPAVPEEPISKLGDLWVLGDHRLLCGDARDPDSFVRLLGEERADMVWTDPPYGVDYEGGQNPSNTKRERLEGDDGTGAYRDALPLIAKWSTDAAPLYLWFAGTRGSSVYAVVEEAGYRIGALIIWHKLNAHYGAFMARYMPKHEPCIYAVRATAPWFGPSNEVSVWEHDQPARNELHPTQKPVVLAERAIRNSSSPGALVLDPFAGSGTTLVACEQEGRKARCIELSPAYADVIVARWEALTGGKATRE